MKILGISPYHDSSACLIENGKIISFYKEERLSGVKRDNYPFLSIENIIRDHGPVDVAVIASPSNGDITLEPLKIYLQKVHGIKKIEDISNEHHLQHASLAFYNSGFDRSLIFVVDRNGSFLNSECRESETVFIAEYPNIFIPIYKNYWLSDMKFLDQAMINVSEKYKNIDHEISVDILTTHGIVKTYESATTLIGQHPLENGKVMGLSAYGKYNSNYDNLFLNDNIGNYHKLSTKAINGFHSSVNTDIQEFSNKNITENNYKIYADYSLAVQEQTQIAALSLIKKWVEKTGINKICITGGYGLNVVANGFYQKNCPELNFYFEPIADDTGNSIGAALLYYRSYSKDFNRKPLETTFFHGKKYQLDQIIADNKVSIIDVTDFLIDQKTLAIYHGLAEAGPRALGHRSILFDARNPNAKKITNLVKKREWYRPFAGIMLLEDAQRFFYINDFENSKYMTVNFKSKPEATKFIPGILHVDDTCRIQIVTDPKEPIYQLLQIFKEKTGIGVLLNTSFNLAGKPLVETPDDALWTLKNSSLDGVWFPENETLHKNFNHDIHF